MSVNWKNASKLRRVGAGFAALAAVLAVCMIPSAVSAAVTPADGADFILPDNDVYQLGPNGAYHLIPDVATADAMGIKWNQLARATSLSPIGAAFTSVLPPAAPTPMTLMPPTTLANGQDFILPDHAVYQRDGSGVYHWIPDLATANAMGLKWSGLRTVKAVSPIGSAIKSVIVYQQPSCTHEIAPTTKANGLDFVVAPNTTVYQRDLGGVYHMVPNIATANAMGIDWGHLKSIKSASPLGQPIRSVCVA